MNSYSLLLLIRLKALIIEIILDNLFWRTVWFITTALPTPFEVFDSSLNIYVWFLWTWLSCSRNFHLHSLTEFFVSNCMACFNTRQKPWSVHGITYFINLLVSTGFALDFPFIWLWKGLEEWLISKTLEFKLQKTLKERFLGLPLNLWIYLRLSSCLLRFKGSLSAWTIHIWRLRLWNESGP